jgi:hypothetical protein
MVCYQRARCAACEQWHAIEPEAVLELPYPGAIYFDIAFERELPTAEPSCDPDIEELDTMATEEHLHPVATESDKETAC